MHFHYYFFSFYGNYLFLTYYFLFKVITMKQVLLLILHLNCVEEVK